MAEILYVYKNQVYVNLTNRCSANCVFCVRNKKDGMGKNKLVLEQDPTQQELREQIDAFDFREYGELVFCGYGEPTCALDNLLATADYFKKNHRQKIRLNTNGLGNLYHGRNILPELNRVVDSYSISLNAPNAERYNQLVRSPYENAFSEVLGFAREAKSAGKEVVFSVLSILADEEIKACHTLSKEMGIPLKVRAYERG
jgi:TatD family-associated radical SAM protein